MQCYNTTDRNKLIENRKSDDTMDSAKKVRMLMAACDINASKLAELTGISQSNMSKKLKNNNFSVEDLEKIGNALGVKFEGYFIFDNGDKI